jgi:type II secretory ATPase GspE/PulE/Tfp pilus assembly ATPase PilB-like protein
MPRFDDTATNIHVGELHRAEEERLVSALAVRQNLPYINLFETPIDIGALRLLTETESRSGELAVFAQKGHEVHVAVRNPNHPGVPDVMKKLDAARLTPVLHLASFPSVTHAWDRYKDIQQTTARAGGVLDVDYELIEKFMKEVTSHLDVGARVATAEREQSPTRTSNVIALFFGGALALRASDIHIEPEQAATRIRYRLDGVLWDVCDIQHDLAQHIVSRLKLLSGLKLNVRKLAQDGRFTFRLSAREVEVRTSVIPGGFGESVVMRLLDPSVANLTLDNLDLNPKLRSVLAEELARPNGAILTTGPTGSGKTTALYTFLATLNSPELKIVTIEDPIEYKLPGIVQTQATKGFSFADGLRSMLRQDPDVILIGEIRDKEVAETAIHAALTGHLVLSTLHTNSAVGAFPRLIDIGVDPHMLGSAINLVLGQRLVRTLCDACKVEREMTTEEQKLAQRIIKTPLAIHTTFDAKGCDACSHSGYKGRVGVFEAVRMDTVVEAAILKDPRESVIREAAAHQEIPTMQQDGVMKVLAGITTFDEIGRVLDLQHTE